MSDEYDDIKAFAEALEDFMIEHNVDSYFGSFLKDSQYFSVSEFAGVDELVNHVDMIDITYSEEIDRIGRHYIDSGATLQ